VIKAEQDLRGKRGEGGKGEQGRETTQIMYAHVNKKNN
jgi:hypothetical protein